MSMLLDTLTQLSAAKRRQEEFDRELAAKQSDAAAQRALMGGHYAAQEANWKSEAAARAATEERMRRNTDSEIEHRKAIEGHNAATLRTNILKDLPLDSSDPNALAGREAALKAAGLDVKSGVDALSPEEVQGRFEQKMNALQVPEAQAIQGEAKFADAAEANPEGAKRMDALRGMPGLGAMLPSVPESPPPEARTWSDSVMSGFQGDRYEAPIDPNKKTIVDQSGAPMVTFDPAMNALHRARTAEQLQSTLSSLPGVGGRASAVAGALAQVPGMDVSKAAAAGLEAGQKREALDTSEKNAARIAAMRQETTSSEGENRSDLQIHRFADKVKQFYRLPEAQAAEDAANQAMKQMATPSGISDTVAMAKLGRSLYGAAQSNQEGGRLFNAGGLMTRIENAISRLDNGEMSDDFRKDFTELSKRMIRFSQQRKMTAAKRSRAIAEKSPIKSVRDNAGFVSSLVAGVDLMGDDAPAPAVVAKPRKTTTTVSGSAQGGEDPNKAVLDAIKAIRGGSSGGP